MLITYSLQLLVAYRYALIVPVAIVEGPVIMLLCGFLVKMGAFSIIPTYLLLMLGDLIGDVFWYFVGYFFGMRFIKRFGKFFSVGEKDVKVAEKFFHKYNESILIISKVTMGFGFALVTLIVAGMVKIPFRKYFLLNLIGEFFWTGGLLALGYAFGNFYAQFNDVFGRISAISLFVVAAALFIGFGRYIHAKILTTYSS